MNEPNYSHAELVTAVFEKTYLEIDQNPRLAHLSHVALLRLVAMILTPTGVASLVAERPELRGQFDRTVRWCKNRT